MHVVFGRPGSRRNVGAKLGVGYRTLERRLAQFALVAGGESFQRKLRVLPHGHLPHDEEPEGIGPILADEIQRGVDEGVFRPCDAWEMANILWIVGNGLLETDLDPARRSLRGRDLEQVFQDALDLMLRGLRA